MRSFNWQAECIELANMKAEGQASKDLAEVFGLHKTAIDRKISMGEALRRVNECRPALIGENQFLNHIMPLRIPPDVTYKGKKGFLNQRMAKGLKGITYRRLPKRRL